LALLLSCCAPSAALSGSESVEFRVGRAAVDITPERGMAMGGYFFVRLNEGVHDRLFAKAIVIEDGANKAALVACDLESLPGSFVTAARQEAAAKTGIPTEHIMISATHTHTGPEMSELFIQQLHGTAAGVAARYRAELSSRIAEAVRLASADLRPAVLWSGVGSEPSLCFNRRYVMKDGTVRFNPGKLNPDIIRPAGPTDPEVSVVYFAAQDQSPLATYVNYALHLDTTGGLEYSADYPNTLANVLGSVKGPAMMTLFTIGTAGNVNHLDVRTRDRQSGFGEASRIGSILAAEVLKTYSRMQPTGGHLQVRGESIKLPVIDVSAEAVASARQIFERAVKSGEGAGGSPQFLDVVNAVKTLTVAEYDRKPINAEVQVISVGTDLAWVGLPGEIFVELGKAIKLASPFRQTIVVELASDSIDYVPDRKGFAEGAYEPATARCKPGSGEALVDAATRVLLEAHTAAEATPGAQRQGAN
jgi:hypothetical protein